METRITAYEVLRAVELSDLIGAVNTLLQDGWQPNGAVVITVDPSNVYFFHQVMVKLK